MVMTEGVRVRVEENGKEKQSQCHVEVQSGSSNRR